MQHCPPKSALVMFPSLLVYALMLLTLEGAITINAAWHDSRFNHAEGCSLPE